ncbi:uncharacterized protein LOC105665968 [Bombus terrestris]|uniref:Uncharacterized protein LOC105665968 n=1 Tax=Bombus terrestris TaxID=30195 RepID=A0A9B2MQ17_BOMTE|nr:uncharacterized protein LOC105665968 [Bombus terrestris]
MAGLYERRATSGGYTGYEEGPKILSTIRVADVRSRSQGTLCKFTQEVRVVSERPLRRPRRRRLPGGIRERRHGRKSCNTVVSRRYGLPTGAYRYTQALCRTEVEYGLYWRHLLHG